MGVEEEEAEYESDPEDALLPSAMRRRVASDDEEDGGESDGVGDRNRRGRGASDDGSDGQGAAPTYEDEEEELGEGGDVEELVGEGEGRPEVGVEERRNEPLAGAFYMHDDRFGGSRGRGRPRHILHVPKLWESNNDHAWVHDRFQDTDAHLNERAGRGRLRDQGRTRGTVWGYGRGNRYRNYVDNRYLSYDDQPLSHNDRPHAYNETPRAHKARSKSHDGKSYQQHAPRIVRGRGPTRYKPLLSRNRETEANTNKEYSKLHELPSSNSAAGRESIKGSSAQHELHIPRKQVFTSNLSPASAPFYPSGSSKTKLSVVSNHDLQTGNINRTVSYMRVNDVPPCNSSLLRGKSSITYVGQERSELDRTLRIHGNPLANPHLRSSQTTSSPDGAIHSLRFQARGRGLSLPGQSNFRETSLPSLVGKMQAQMLPIQQRPTESLSHPSLQQSASQFNLHRSGGTLTSDNLQLQLANALEFDVQPSSGPSEAKDVVGIENNQSEGRGVFMSNMSRPVAANGDQNFPGTPVILPVMQFGGQHHDGLGVRAMGMSLPSYGAQPDSSEMDWWPMFSGAAGTLGGSYGSYSAMGSGYHNRATRSPSLSATSRGSGPAKPVDTWSTPRSEVQTIGNESRQYKPRRYSEMNFGR